MSRIEDTAHQPPPAEDFSPRSRNGGKRLVMFLFLLFALLATADYVFGGIIANRGAFTFLLVALAGAIALMASVSLQRTHDLLTEVEFQNTLFSSALARHSDFTLIIRADGSFAYADRGFSAVFPGFPVNGRSLENLLDASGVARSDAERLYEAIRSRRRDWFLFPLVNAAGQTTQMILNLFPLARPDGFFLIQGREIVERSNGDRHQYTKGICGPSYRYMMYLFNEMPMAAYALSPSGHLRAANQLLERWLGYDVGEIAESGLAFSDLVYRTDDEPLPEFEMKEYIGPIILARKNGSLFRAKLEQHVVRDEEGNILSVIGIIRDKSGA